MYETAKNNFIKFVDLMKLGILNPERYRITDSYKSLQLGILDIETNIDFRIRVSEIKAISSGFIAEKKLQDGTAKTSGDGWIRQEISLPELGKIMEEDRKSTFEFLNKEYDYDTIRSEFITKVKEF